MTTQEIEAHISTLWSHLQDIAESDVSIETKIDLIKEINHWNDKLEAIEAHLSYDTSNT